MMICRMSMMRMREVVICRISMMRMRERDDDL